MIILCSELSVEYLPFHPPPLTANSQIVCCVLKGFNTGSGVFDWAKAQLLTSPWLAQLSSSDMSRAYITPKAHTSPLMRYVAIGLAVFIYAVLLIPLVAI